MPRIKFHNAANLQGTAKKKYDEDEDFEETESDNTDSDFEDPDTMEVPKTLSAGIKKQTQQQQQQNNETTEISDDDIEVISSTNNGRAAFGANRGTALHNTSTNVIVSAAA